MIYIIAAVDQSGVIGYQNMIPWHYPEDLKFFQKMTLNHKILMGLNTFNSIKKPLKNRENFVASLSNIAIAGVTIVNDVNAFLAKYIDSPEIVFVIGGASIYQLALPYASKMFLTRIPGVHQGDCFFPPFGAEFKLVDKIKLTALEVEVYHRD